MGEGIVKRVLEEALVEVKCVFKNEDGCLRWWFWLEGEESVLKLINGAHFDVSGRLRGGSLF